MLHVRRVAFALALLFVVGHDADAHQNAPASPAPSATPLDPDAHQNVPASPVPSATPLDADAMFERARAVANARVAPDFFGYHLDVNVSRKGKLHAFHFHVTVRSRDGGEFIEPIPDSAADKIDTTPSASQGDQYVDITTTFGLSARRKNAKPTLLDAVPSPQPSATDAAVIGRSKASYKEYDVTYVGPATIGGHATDHLHLQPRFNRSEHELRELFVDHTTGQVIRITIEGNVQAGPVRLGHPYIDIDYVPFESTSVISRMSVDLGLRALIVSVVFNIQLKSSDFVVLPPQPDWMFDPKLLEAHRKAEPPANPSPKP